MDNEAGIKKTTKKIKIEKNKKSVVDPQTKWLKTHLKEYFFDNISSSSFKNLSIFNQKYILKNIGNSQNQINLRLAFNFFKFYHCIGSYPPLIILNEKKYRISFNKIF